eukprot:TRINITY_DN45246_c0_g1_i1.p1 TRINITY_DN45246_c0_g1~~TRINITY_DN45246_c0_g1_i1.p1  ORF type:complete len:166 (+),score=33.14 TRINITY_DN45246_c0_g1_i1:102-599(+)
MGRPSNKGGARQGGGKGKGLQVDYQVQPAISKWLASKARGKGRSAGGGDSAAVERRRDDSTNDEGHTILLVQFHAEVSSRTWTEHEDVGAAMDALCQYYEQALKMELQADTAKYRMDELWEFVDNLEDIVCLVCSSRTGDYGPRDREWIKARVLKHLSAQVGTPR